MANLSRIVGDFDARLVEPGGTFEPLPPGDYEVVISNSEFKATKNGKGRYLELQLTVFGGPHNGRLLFDRLNLDNPNEKAVEIARATLSAISRAVGVPTPRDSVELHDKPLIAVVKTKLRDDNGEPANEVKGYKPLTSEAARTQSKRDKAATEAIASRGDDDIPF